MDAGRGGGGAREGRKTGAAVDGRGADESAWRNSIEACFLESTGFHIFHQSKNIECELV